MNYFEKIRKNILQPITYHWAALSGRMPSCEINLGTLEAPLVRKWYTKLIIKRFFIINKTVALAVIDLTRFSKFDDYLNTVKGKNSVKYYRNRVIKNGFVFSEINPNEYLHDIYEINISADKRGGRKMTEEYQTKDICFQVSPEIKSYGVFIENKLVAYLTVVFLNEAVLVDKLLGHKKYLVNGIMYLLIANAIQQVYELNKSDSFNAKYFIYDSFITNGKGLTFFKKRFAFAPYRVNWKTIAE